MLTKPQDSSYQIVEGALTWAAVEEMPMDVLASIVAESETAEQLEAGIFAAIWLKDFTGKWAKD